MRQWICAGEAVKMGRFAIFSASSVSAYLPSTFLVYEEEVRPDRKPHNPRAANGRLARAHHPSHFILAGERSKIDLVKEAFSLFAHIHRIIVLSNKCFANRIKQD
jgi:hypothetical protein